MYLQVGCDELKARNGHVLQCKLGRNAPGSATLSGVTTPNVQNRAPRNRSGLSIHISALATVQRGHWLASPIESLRPVSPLWRRFKPPHADPVGFEFCGPLFATSCEGLDFDSVRLIISAMHTKGAPRPRKGTIPPLLFCFITTHSLLARRSGSRAPKKE
jgi:hypothetical protein